MSFYNFVRNEAGEDMLYIDGEIVCDVDWWGPSGQVVARKFRQRLDETGDVVVWINSPGGDVFAAAEIYTALREHKGKVTVKVTGIAASAASVIAMAGDTVLMSRVAYMMIHDPWTYARGNYRDMEHMSAILKEIGEGITAAYMAKTGKSRDEITELLAAETYMSAERAVAEGFADGLMETDDKAQPDTAKNGKGTLMRASAYSPAAICAKMTGNPSVTGTGGWYPPLRAATPPPKGEARERAEIIERAKVIATMYP